MKGAATAENQPLPQGRVLFRGDLRKNGQLVHLEGDVNFVVVLSFESNKHSDANSQF